VAVLYSCGGGTDEGTQTQQTATQTQQRPPGTQAIPDQDFSEFENLAAAYLKPYFDEAGTITSKKIEPGERFDVWLFAEFNELYPMSAAQWRIQMPAGTTIMSSLKSDSTIVMLGDAENDFMMAFNCFSGPRIWLMKYVCKASEDFAGGELETLPGNNLNFLGFTMCDATRTLIRGRGGKATLDRM
jgi:hypothetical protein